MISYTDDRDTIPWRGLKGAPLVEKIARELASLFPGVHAPEPEWVRPYEWSDGTTYWRPGPYDPVAMSRAAMQPRPATMPGLFICGEPFSVGHQAWMEGALEHAELLWNIHLSHMDP